MGRGRLTCCSAGSKHIQFCTQNAEHRQIKGFQGSRKRGHALPPIATAVQHGHQRAPCKGILMGLAQALPNYLHRPKQKLTEIYLLGGLPTSVICCRGKAKEALDCVVLKQSGKEKARDDTTLYQHTSGFELS